MAASTFFGTIGLLFLTGCMVLPPRGGSPAMDDTQPPASAKNRSGMPPTLGASRYPAGNLIRTPELPMAFAALHLTRVDGNTWRTAANPVVVHGIMSRILSQSYLIAGIDRKNLSIQTDWDKFFIDGRLFRNRMSVTVFPVSAKQTEVVIRNSVEYYTGNVAKQDEGGTWLPSPDLTNEVAKLIETTDRQTAYAYAQAIPKN